MIEVLHDFNVFALSVYPDEAVAIMYDDVFHTVKNISSDPIRRFKVPPLDLIRAFNSDTGLQAIAHSHTAPNSMPSQADIDLQKHFNVPFVIITTDGTTVIDAYSWK